MQVDKANSLIRKGSREKREKNKSTKRETANRKKKKANHDEAERAHDDIARRDHKNETTICRNDDITTHDDT